MEGADILLCSIAMGVALVGQTIRVFRRRVEDELRELGNEVHRLNRFPLPSRRQCSIATQSLCDGGDSCGTGTCRRLELAAWNIQARRAERGR